MLKIEKKIQINLHWPISEYAYLYILHTSNLVHCRYIVKNYKHYFLNNINFELLFFNLHTTLVFYY